MADIAKSLKGKELESDGEGIDANVTRIYATIAAAAAAAAQKNAI